MTDTKTKTKRTRKPKAEADTAPEPASPSPSDVHASLAATAEERDALAARVVELEAKLAHAVTDAEQARQLAAMDASKAHALKMQARAVEWKDRAKAAEERLADLTKRWDGMVGKLAAAEQRAEAAERVAATRDHVATARPGTVLVRFEESGAVGGGVISAGQVARNPPASWLTLAHRHIDPATFQATPIELRVGFGG